MNAPRDEEMPEATRIRGRMRGFETVWTPERFGEVIRKEVSVRLERSWPQERISGWVRDAYAIDPRSEPQMQRVVARLLAQLRSDGRGHSAGPGRLVDEARRAPGPR